MKIINKMFIYDIDNINGNEVIASDSKNGCNNYNITINALVATLADRATSVVSSVANALKQTAW